MHYFRNMQELENTDITKHPAYNNLSDENRRKVAETYTNVFNNNQGRMGIKIAQGIAFATASKMCEGFDAAPGTIADDEGIVDSTISKPGPTYETQTHVVKNIVYGKKTCGKNGCKNKGIEHVHPDDELHPHGLSMGAMERKYGLPDKHLRMEGDAEDFQANNDAMVGMTEDDEMAHKGGTAQVPTADPEEGGAAKLLRFNHDAKCMNCGAVHPFDVVCYNGNSHSEAPGGAGDILKNNHAQKGMKTEESDPLISGAAAYLTRRAKISGIVESVTNPGRHREEEVTEWQTAKQQERVWAPGLKVKEGTLPSDEEVKAADARRKEARKEARKKLKEGDAEVDEAIEQMWAENYFPAKPLEESCGNCCHPQSYHSNGCMTCNECEGFTTEINESKKSEICFCGHGFGDHSKGGCKSCKKEGYMTPEKAAHQPKIGNHSEKFEAEYAQIFAAQQGKINMANANASLNWLPEELELTEGKGYEDIGPGDHVIINHPLRGSDTKPQQGKGRVVMKGSHGWVLNMGGKHGTPGIATPDNYVSHRKAKKKKMTEDEMAEERFRNALWAKDAFKTGLHHGARETKETGSLKKGIKHGVEMAKSHFAARKGNGFHEEEIPAVKEETGIDALMAASLDYIKTDVARSGGKLFKITEEDMKKPPHLREASGDKNCGNCSYFGENKCKMYDGYPVDSDDICDEYVAK